MSSTSRNPFSKTPTRPRPSPSQPRNMGYDATPPTAIHKQRPPVRKMVVKREPEEDYVEPAKKVKRSEVVVKEEPMEEIEEYSEVSHDQNHGFGKTDLLISMRETY